MFTVLNTHVIDIINRMYKKDIPELKELSLSPSAGLISRGLLITGPKVSHIILRKGGLDISNVFDSNTGEKLECIGEHTDHDVSAGLMRMVHGDKVSFGYLYFTQPDLNLFNKHIELLTLDN